MADDTIILALYIIVILSALCVCALIGDLIFNWQESKEAENESAKHYCAYGLVNTGACLKPRAKKCNFTTAMRNILAKLRFN